MLGRDVERYPETCEDSVSFFNIILNVPQCLDLMHDKFLSHLSGFTIDSGSCTRHQQIKLQLMPPVCTAVALFTCIQQMPVLTQAVQRVFHVSLSTTNQIF